MTIIKSKKTKLLFLLLFAFGFLSSVTQLSYLRIAAFVFSGNEITISILLGHWLIFTALGSYSGALFHKKISQKFHSFAFLFSIFTLLFYWLIYLSRRLWQIDNFLILSTGKIFFMTALLLALPTMLNGFLFPFITQKIVVRAKYIRVNLIYGTELLGAALGSFVFTLWLFFSLKGFYLLLLSNLLFLILIVLRLHSPFKKIISLILILLSVSQLTFYEDELAQTFYQNFHLESKNETPFGILTALSTENSNGIYSDNVFLWNSESFQAAEEKVHFSLSLAKNPKNVLIIGNSDPLLLTEIAKYDEVRKVNFYGNDRIQFEQLFSGVELKNFPFDFEPHFGDPFELIQKRRDKFDVILLNVPEPTNLRWNRYFTLEFFKMLHFRMTKNAIMDLPVPASETFMTTAEQDFLKILKNSLSKVFTKVMLIPGETLHFIVSDDCENISVRNLKIKPKNNHFINENYLSDRLSEFKINFLTTNLEQSKTTAVNSLFKPLGFYYSTVMWGQQSAGLLSNIYQKLHQIPVIYIFLSLIGLSLMGLIFKKGGVGKKSKMVFFGFFVMAQESLLIYLYQSLAGAVYLRTALIIFLFMAGAGFSSLLYHKIPLSENIIFLLANLINLTGLLVIYFNFLSFLINPAIFLTGILSGQIFPLLLEKANSADKEKVTNTGKFYACDVFGGSIGLYLISIIVLPVWGFFPAFGIIQIILLFFSINNMLHKTSGV